MTRTAEKKEVKEQGRNLNGKVPGNKQGTQSYILIQFIQRGPQASHFGLETENVQIIICIRRLCMVVPSIVIQQKYFPASSLSLSGLSHGPHRPLCHTCRPCSWHQWQRHKTVELTAIFSQLSPESFDLRCRQKKAEHVAMFSWLSDINWETDVCLFKKCSIPIDRACGASLYEVPFKSRIPYVRSPLKVEFSAWCPLQK